MKEIVEHLKRQFVVPVIGHAEKSKLIHIAEAMHKGGLSLMEVVLRHQDTMSVIQELTKNPDLIVGAGTVLTLQDTQNAIKAGARFLVSPGLNVAAVEYAHKHNVPFIPGVMTPTEIMKAQDLGCEMVKIFPVSSLGGANYIKLLRGPFFQMQWMCTGGVALADIPEYRAAGVSCVGLGTQLMPEKIIAAQDWQQLTELAISARAKT